MEGLYKLLEAEAGLSPSEVDKYFAISMNEENYILKLRGGAWIEASTAAAMQKIVKNTSGSYSPTPKPATYTLPKKEVSAISSYKECSLIEDDGEDVRSTAYSLTASKEGLGELTPVLLDAHGEIIDGFHRTGEAGSWRTEKLPWIDTKTKLELARLAVNFNRRTVTPHEIRERIANILKEDATITPDDIARLTGISLTTIYKYMPQELKNPSKVAAGRESAKKRAKTKQEQHVEPEHEISVPLAEQTAANGVSAEEHNRLMDALDEARYPNCPVCLQEPTRIIGDLPHVQCENGHDWNLKTGELLGDTKNVFPEDEDGDTQQQQSTCEGEEEPSEAPATAPVDYDSVNKSCPICGGPISPEKYERLKKKFGAKYPDLFAEAET